MQTLFEQYLKSKHWKQLETEAISSAVCCKCGEETFLSARHKTYERLGQEVVTDLEAVCKYCEQAWPREMLSDKDVRLCDPHGWVAYAIISSREWNGYDDTVYNAWFEHRTLSAALKAYQSAQRKVRKRKYPDPERPQTGADKLSLPE